MKKFILVALVVMFSATSVNAGVEGRCKGCHSFGEKNKVGPSLKGIFGKEAGTVEGFKYSKSLKKGGWVWSEENLRAFLSNTKKGIKELSGDDAAKTKMGYKMKGKKLDGIIEYLKGAAE